MTCKFTEDSGEFLYPMTINLTFEMLDENGIYLMDLGDSLILYLRKKAKIEDKEALFVQVSGEKKIEIEWSEKMSNFLSELTRSFFYLFGANETFVYNIESKAQNIVLFSLQGKEIIIFMNESENICFIFCCNFNFFKNLFIYLDCLSNIIQ